MIAASSKVRLSKPSICPSVVPADDNSPLDIPQRQGRRLRVDRIACGARETAPGLDRYCPQRTSPCPDDLATDEDAARPYARRPERAATRGIRDQELTIASLEKVIRVPAREEPRAHGGGGVLRDAQRATFVRQPPEREDREVPCRDDVRVVTRPPDLDERRVFPGRGLGPLDPRMDREQRSAGHAVLQARPRRTPERAPSAWEPLVERADLTAECEDLCAGEAERRPCHVRPPHARYL